MESVAEIIVDIEMELPANINMYGMNQAEN